MLTFVNEDELFRNTLSYLIPHSIHIPYDDMKYLYEVFLWKEHEEYNQYLSQVIGQKIDRCSMLTPAMELVRNYRPETSTILHYHMQAQLSRDKVKFTLNYHLEAGKEIAVTHHLTYDPEALLLHFGIFTIGKKPFIPSVFQMEVSQKMFPAEKAEFCSRMDCCGIDPKKMAEEGIEKMTVQLGFTDQGLDHSFLNLMKILGIDQGKLKIDVHLHWFKSFKPFHYTVELSSLLRYYDFFLTQGKPYKHVIS